MQARTYTKAEVQLMSNMFGHQFETAIGLYKDSSTIKVGQETVPTRLQLTVKGRIVKISEQLSALHIPSANIILDNGNLDAITITGEKNVAQFLVTAGIMQQKDYNHLFNIEQEEQENRVGILTPLSTRFSNIFAQIRAATASPFLDEEEEEMDAALSIGLVGFVAALGKK